VHPGERRSNENPGVRLAAFVRENNITILNVAGSRGSKEPTVASFVKRALEEALYPRAEAMVVRGLWCPHCLVRDTDRTSLPLFAASKACISICHEPCADRLIVRLQFLVAFAPARFTGAQFPKFGLFGERIRKLMRVGLTSSVTAPLTIYDAIAVVSLPDSGCVTVMIGGVESTKVALALVSL
jgi:hypothetical protein